MITMQNMIEIKDRRLQSRGIISRIPSDKYEIQAAEARELFEGEYSGYLSRTERAELEGFLGKTLVLWHTNISRTKARIKRLVDVGIPPVYNPQIENPIEGSAFPVEDFLIQLSTGALTRKRAAQQIKNRRENRKNSFVPIFPSTLEDILAFRTLAFDGDSLSPQVIRDIASYVREKQGEDLSTSLIRNDYLVLKHLEETLRLVAPGERAYKEFNEGEDLGFLRKRFWHTDYTPEDRVRIVKDFKKRVENREKIFRDYATKHIERVRELFSDVIDIDLHRIKVTQNLARMAYHAQIGDYRGMPQVVLVDPIYEPYNFRQVLIDHVKREGDMLIVKDKLLLFSNINAMDVALRIPRGLQYLGDFREVVTQKRLEVLEGMSDSEFREYFNNKDRVASLGHRQYASENSLDQRFREVLSHRYKTLCA